MPRVFATTLTAEAARRIPSVEVTVTGQFGKEGEPASSITYDVKIESPGTTSDDIAEIIRHVDSVAEVHNTLRKGIPVTLRSL